MAKLIKKEKKFRKEINNRGKLLKKINKVKQKLEKDKDKNKMNFQKKKLFGDFSIIHLIRRRRNFKNLMNMRDRKI